MRESDLTTLACPLKLLASVFGAIEYSKKALPV